MNINSACILEDRGILFVDGIDAKDFLQNIITNDIDKVSDNSSCFASLLTPQGKFLFDFIVVKHKKGYFIDCEKIQIEELFKHPIYCTDDFCILNRNLKRGPTFPDNLDSL